MKYALIGCGRISPNHIGSAIDHKLDIRAVCDVKREKAEALLARFQLENVKIYTDYRAMLDEVQPELVAVATESGYHPDIAIDCIRHGCNVIIEKPLALSMADARRVIAARDEMGVVACINQQNRFNAPIQLLRKDLEQEFRTKEMLTSMGIYALLVLVVYGAALAQTTSTLDVLQMSGGLLWALIVFTSLLGLNRSFAHEKEQGCLEGILLVPLDRSVIFLAKATSNLLFLLAVEVVAVPLFYFFFLTTVTPGESFWLLAVPLFVGTVGVAGIGTLLSTITVNTRGKDVMLAVLFIPLVFPLLWACVSATTAVVVGAEGYMDVMLTSLALGVGYDVVMLLASWVLYDFVISA